MRRPKATSNNGMHPTADTHHFMLRQRCGAAGDAWRYALATCGRAVL